MICANTAICGIWASSRSPALPGCAGERWASAVGNGGQRLFVVPGQDAVLAITAGGYDDPDSWRAPTAVLREVFIPSLSP